MVKFRLLRADEIDCRISTIKEEGLVLLLYKDARCDMNILDETVGAENWQRKHELINGNLFCSVGIRVERDTSDEWVWKQDVGTESYTEKEKGEASDSFKRACFNWGIGRELYTAPFMWVPKNDANIVKKDGKHTCFDRFKVTRLEYAEGKISFVEVMNTKTKALLSYGRPQENIPEAPKKLATAEQKEVILGLCKKHKVNLELWLQQSNVRMESLTMEQAGIMLQALKTKYGDD